jgi:hypothetical protein
MRQVIFMPSANGHGEYDRYLFAPEGMGADDAKQRINTEIVRLNTEAAQNGEVCDDGLDVEESLKATLEQLGFEFFRPAVTHYWDEVPR